MLGKGSNWRLIRYDHERRGGSDIVTWVVLDRALRLCLTTHSFQNTAIIILFRKSKHHTLCSKLIKH